MPFRSKISFAASAPVMPLAVEILLYLENADFTEICAQSPKISAGIINIKYVIFMW